MPQGNREDPNDAMPHEPPYVCKNGHSYMQTTVGCVACLPRAEQSFSGYGRVSVGTNDWSTTSWTTTFTNV